MLGVYASDLGTYLDPYAGFMRSGFTPRMLCNNPRRKVAAARLPRTAIIHIVLPTYGKLPSRSLDGSSLLVVSFFSAPLEAPHHAPVPARWARIFWLSDQPAPPNALSGPGARRWRAPGPEEAAVIFTFSFMHLPAATTCVGLVAPATVSVSGQSLARRAAASMSVVPAADLSSAVPHGSVLFLLAGSRIPGE